MICMISYTDCKENKKPGEPGLINDYTSRFFYFLSLPVHISTRLRMPIVTEIKIIIEKINPHSPISLKNIYPSNLLLEIDI